MLISVFLYRVTTIAVLIVDVPSLGTLSTGVKDNTGCSKDNAGVSSLAIPKSGNVNFGTLIVGISNAYLDQSISSEPVKALYVNTPTTS